MRKWRLTSLFLLLTLFIVTGYSLAATNYAKFTDPKSLVTHHPGMRSTKGVIDLTEDVPEDGIIRWIKLKNGNIFSSCGEYGEIHIEIWDEEGNHTRLLPDIKNEDFAGKSAHQKFYITFYTDRMEFKGNPLHLGRAVINFDVDF